MQTTRIYRMLLFRSPEMTLKKGFVNLSYSAEFDPRHNSGGGAVVVRQTDDVLVRQLMSYLPEMDDEKPKKSAKAKRVKSRVTAPYAVKARTLIYSHLYRMPLTHASLEQDRDYVVISCANQRIIISFDLRPI